MRMRKGVEEVEVGARAVVSPVRTGPSVEDAAVPGAGAGARAKLLAGVGADTRAGHHPRLARDTCQGRLHALVRVLAHRHDSVRAVEVSHQIG
jgi:hypothetical protein